MAQLERESESEQLNILPEARLIRALASDFVTRYTELVDALIAWNKADAREALWSKTQPRPQRIPDIAEASKLLVDAAQVVDRIHKQRSANAVSRADLLRILSEMGRTVELHVTDDTTRERIKAGWQTIRL